MVLCFALWSCFPMCRAPSLAVAASRCCIAAGCASRCCWFGRLLVPKVPCFALGAASRWCWFGRMRVPKVLVQQVARPDGALLCAVKLLPDGALRLPCWQLLLDDAGAASAENLPRIGSRGAATSSAQTCASLAGPSHSRGTWASTVCAEEFPTPLEASVRRGWTGLSEVSC